MSRKGKKSEHFHAEATQQHLYQNFAQRTHQDFTDFSYFRLTCVTETELKFYSIPAPDDMEPK